MTSVKILQYNCQGANNNGKRIDLFQHLKEQKCEIYCLVDTHFSQKDQNLIRSQWNSDCVFNSYSSNSRGIAILFNNIEYELHTQLNDTQGNYLIVDISVQSKRFTLAVIYGPNVDSPQFFKALFEEIDSIGNESLIMCGDFNLVLEPDLDYHNYRHINNRKARQLVLDEIEIRNLKDSFRILSPLQRRYTWRRTNPLQQARLDFFLVTDDIHQQVNKCKIGISYRSDHSMVTLEIDFFNIKKGKSLWKHNNALLKDIDYINTINEKIKEIKQQYALPVYNHENISDVPDDEIQFVIDDQLFLETLLMELRGKSISFASFRKKQTDKHEQELIKRIKNIEENLTENNQDELNNLRSDLEKLRHEKMKGKVIRSRAQWIEEGEKPSKFFCNLENQNYINKTMYKLKNNNSEIIYDQLQILEETKNFYSNLYSNKDDEIETIEMENYLADFIVPKLNSDEALMLEGSITLSEATHTLKNMSNNKSPGSDGFSSEFFKVFWRYLGHFVIRSLNYGFQKEELSITQREGIITCIPKENKPKELLKNWRPITLLNVVYKIASGAIANRLKSHLDKLIHPDQTGFIHGRYIGENTRLIYDMMHYTEENNIPALLLLIDFEKAFDSLSWSFIDKVMKYFNIGESFRKWVKVFYKNSKSAVIQSGHLSSFFYLGRGCRQGDPISPYLFLLCAEVLAIRIRNNKNIKGIKFDDKEMKISQYADDTALTLDGSKKSLNESLYELDRYAAVSGLKANFDKTHVIWLGLKKYSQQTINTRYKLVWGKTRFKLLGIDFSVNLDEMMDINFKPKMEKVKNQLAQWERRNLTVIGKITVIKTVVLPKFNHLFMALPNPSQVFMKTLNDSLQEFLWHGPNRVKSKVLVKSYRQGGLKMIDTFNFISSLKLTWIRRLLIDDRHWQLFIKEQVNLNNMFSLGKDYIEVQAKSIKNLFWKDVLHSYIKLIDSTEIDTAQKVLSLPCFYDRVKIGGVGFYNKNWYEHGIRFISDFFNTDGSFYTLENLRNQYKIKINFLQYQSIKASLKAMLCTYNIEVNEKLVLPVLPYYLQIILKSKKGTKDFYDILIVNKESITGQVKWNKEFNFSNEDWKNIFEMPFTVTKCSKLQWFQYRINHRILATNSYLYKTNIVDSPLCEFCKQEDETIKHILWNCSVTQNFLHQIENWSEGLNFQLPQNEKEFLFNIGDFRNKQEEQLIILEIKYYLYTARCLKQKPNILALKRSLKMFYWIHKQLAINGGYLDHFLVTWEFLETLLLDN